VFKSGTSQFPYTSWQTASDSIQKCLDICDNGDTIYVGNGTYKEFLVVNKSIALIGSSMDSTIIDGRNLGTYYTIMTNGNLALRNFTIIGKGFNSERFNSAITVSINCNIDISFCRMQDVDEALFIASSSGIIDNCILSNISYGITTFCFSDTCQPIISNNLIFIRQRVNGIGIENGLGGGRQTIISNIILTKSAANGILNLTPVKSILLSNNIISGFQVNLDYDYLIDTSYIINNILVNGNNQNYANIYGTTGKTIIRNNIIENNLVGISVGTSPPNTNYNLFWNNQLNTTSGSGIGPNDIFADPMFVKDTVPDEMMNFDFHLQKYSPAINSGDPSILDRDGTRSDIGYLGGPGGETYTYNDLAPRAPVGLIVKQDSDKIVVKWRKNTETDFKSYKLFRDTTKYFTEDSTKLISNQTDTIFIQAPQINWKKFYYKLTAEDNQGDESTLSEEIGIITGINDKPQMVSEYRLFQNYPNPFNPSTKISYRLKETGYVKVMVYDIKGALVRVLVNETQAQGFYETEFYAKGLASGIYLYRIEIIGKGNLPVYSDIKKMVYLK
jgi:hypothetical protein